MEEAELERLKKALRRGLISQGEYEYETSYAPENCEVQIEIKHKRGDNPEPFLVRVQMHNNSSELWHCILGNLDHPQHCDNYRFQHRRLRCLSITDPLGDEVGLYRNFYPEPVPPGIINWRVDYLSALANGVIYPDEEIVYILSGIVVEESIRLGDYIPFQVEESDYVVPFQPGTTYQICFKYAGVASNVIDWTAPSIST